VNGLISWKQFTLKQEEGKKKDARLKEREREREGEREGDVNMIQTRPDAKNNF